MSLVELPDPPLHGQVITAEYLNSVFEAFSVLDDGLGKENFRPGMAVRNKDKQAPCSVVPMCWSARVLSFPKNITQHHFPCLSLPTSFLSDTPGVLRDPVELIGLHAWGNVEKQVGDSFRLSLFYRKHLDGAKVSTLDLGEFDPAIGYNDLSSVGGGGQMNFVGVELVVTTVDSGNDRDLVCPRVTLWIKSPHVV
jgi:hypothetical protein